MKFGLLTTHKEEFYVWSRCFQEDSTSLLGCLYLVFSVIFICFNKFLTPDLRFYYAIKFYFFNLDGVAYVLFLLVILHIVLLFGNLDIGINIFIDSLQNRN